MADRDSSCFSSSVPYGVRKYATAEPYEYACSAGPCGTAVRAWAVAYCPQSSSLDDTVLLQVCATHCSRASRTIADMLIVLLLLCQDWMAPTHVLISTGLGGHLTMRQSRRRFLWLRRKQADPITPQPKRASNPSVIFRYGAVVIVSPAPISMLPPLVWLLALTDLCVDRIMTRPGHHSRPCHMAGGADVFCPPDTPNFGCHNRLQATVTPVLHNCI